MKKHRFIIVGSGWRSLYYVRIAKALPKQFELCAMLCRTQEKADKMATEHGIYATISVEECRQIAPDFVVVVVNKADIANVSMEWMEAGFTVLCETPASLELSVLRQLWKLHTEGKRLVVAEQYSRYPQYRAMLSVLEQGLIGGVEAVNLSLAHEYHGARLMRDILSEKVGTAFTVSAKSYSFSTVETLSRYEKFTDGRVADKKRTVATFEFEDGKVCWYDFDSEKYRSPIRHKYVNVQGCKGELRDGTIRYLDEKFEAQEGQLVVTEQVTRRDSDNPNLKLIREVERIDLVGGNGRTEVLYTPEFGICGLPEDETAIASLMKAAGEYTEAAAVGSSEVLKLREQDLREALQDCYMAILMLQADKTGEVIHSEPQDWHAEDWI